LLQTTATSVYSLSTADSHRPSLPWCKQHRHQSSLSTADSHRPSLPWCKQQRHQSTVLVQRTVTGHLCLGANNSDISLQFWYSGQSQAFSALLQTTATSVHSLGTADSHRPSLPCCKQQGHQVHSLGTADSHRPSLPCCKQQGHQSTVLVQRTVTGHLCFAANNSYICPQSWYSRQSQAIPALLQTTATAVYSLGTADSHRPSLPCCKQQLHLSTVLVQQTVTGHPCLAANNSYSSLQSWYSRQSQAISALLQTTVTPVYSLGTPDGHRPSLPCCKQQLHQSTVLVQQTVTGHLCLAANNSYTSLQS